ncbi:MAG: hypothetical protein RI973_93 [Bacteroidota bacterium]|jgi:ATP-binding cassette subfamily B protein
MKAIAGYWKKLFLVAPGMQLSFLLLQVAGAVFPVLGLTAIKLIIDNLLSEKTEPQLVLQGLLWYGIILWAQSLLGGYSSYLSFHLQQKWVDFLSVRILEKNLKIPYPYFENPEYHDALHLSQRQAIYKVPALFLQLSNFLSAFFSIIAVAAYFTGLVGPAALLLIVVSLPVAMQKWHSGRSAYQAEKKVVSLEREAYNLNNILTDPLFIKEARIFGYGPYFIAQFKGIRDKVFGIREDRQKKLTLLSMMAETVEILGILAIIYMQALKAFDNVLAVSVLVVFIQGIQKLKSSFNQFFQSVSQIINQQQFVEDLVRFFDLEEIPGVSKDKKVSGDSAISISKVGFGYPGTGIQVLTDVDMELDRGKIIALVGKNGCGKSTLIKLLAGLYEPDSGTIAMPAGLKMKFVFQDFGKYFLSVGDNIALGENQEERKLEQAAARSGADGFINALPGKYAARLGRNFKQGVQLSGGEWQKLAISRVFYENADLIILDEPTSALDAEAERKVFLEIEKNKQGKMILLVTHRLYNLKIADLIYVMEGGKVVQEGTFDSLLGQEPFKTLYDQQSLKMPDKNEQTVD